MNLTELTTATESFLVNVTIATIQESNLNSTTLQDISTYTLSLQICLILIGTGSLICSGIVFYILMTSVSCKKTTNILIINQLVLDMLACVFLIVTRCVELGITYLSGTSGNYICYFIDSEFMILTPLNGSIANIVMITLERYVKIVHPLYHRKYFKKWMIYVAIIICWVNGILQNILAFWTSGVVDGQCHSWYFWSSNWLKVV